MARVTLVRGLVLAVCWACASCTHEVQTAARAAPRTAVSTVMARHVQQAIDAGEGDVEVRTLRQRLAANANDLDARILLARMYTRRGLPDLALEHYRLAAAQFPDSAVAALSLAKSLRELGQSGAALKSLQQYLGSHTAGTWELLSLEGILEDEQGQFPDAEKAHRAALALDPGRSSLHNNLGYNLLLQGRPEPAAAEFRRAIEIDPRSQIAHNNLGAALASQSQPREALAEWQRAADPAVAHNNLAAVLMEQGRYSDARTELEAALGSRRDFPQALANLQLLAAADGQPATLPAASPHVNLWKRFASTWKGGSGQKPVSSGSQRRSEAANAAPAQPAGGINDTPAGSASGK